MNYRERITIETGKRGGKPRIRGLRISVYDVLEQLAAGMTPGQIIEDFPELEAEDAEPVLAVSDTLWLEVMPKALYPQHLPIPCQALPIHPIEET